MDTEYKFHWWDLNAMRAFIYRQPAPREHKHERLEYFDSCRYKEEYDKIYQMVERFGGKIIHSY